MVTVLVAAATATAAMELAEVVTAMVAVARAMAVMETAVEEMVLVAVAAMAAEVKEMAMVVEARATVVGEMVGATSQQAPYSNCHRRSPPPPRSTSERTSWPRPTNPSCCNSSKDSQTQHMPLHFRPYIR